MIHEYINKLKHKSKSNPKRNKALIDEIRHLFNSQHHSLIDKRMIQNIDLDALVDEA